MSDGTGRHHSTCSVALLQGSPLTQHLITRSTVARFQGESLTQYVDSTTSLTLFFANASNESETIEDPPVNPRKGSFDAPQRIPKDRGFPRRNVPASQLDERRPVRNAESRDDNENRIPNSIQYDAASARTMLEEKPAAAPCTKLASDLSTQNNQIRSVNMMELPEVY
jgi:hypothetical protein